jgi:hypothetical protein
MLSWYHQWEDGNNLIVWFIRTTLLKMEAMGLIYLKTGQLYKFTDIFPGWN